MTEAELEEILKAGEEALEYDSGCLCHDQTVESVVYLVGRAVLHAAAERQRRLPIDDPFLAGQRDALAALIDPDKQEQP